MHSTVRCSPLTQDVCGRRVKFQPGDLEHNGKLYFVSLCVDYISGKILRVGKVLRNTVQDNVITPLTFWLEYNINNTVLWFP